MSDSTAAPRLLHVPSLGPLVRRHPVAAFLVLVYGTISVLALVPALTEPGLLPGRATLHPYTENLLGAAVPAFVVTAIVSGRDGVRDLARRALRWRGHGWKEPFTNAPSARPATWRSNGALTVHDPAIASALEESVPAARR